MGNGAIADKTPHPHSNLCNSRSSIFLKRESLKALMSAYSARPSRTGRASNVPMQPLRRECPLKREGWVCHETNSGLQSRLDQDSSKWNIDNTLCSIGEWGWDGFSIGESTVECIESVVAMLRKAGLDLGWHRVRLCRRQRRLRVGLKLIDVDGVGGQRHPSGHGQGTKELCPAMLRQDADRGAQEGALAQINPCCTAHD
jgi:hypothetical protein